MNKGDIMDQKKNKETKKMIQKQIENINEEIETINNNQTNSGTEIYNN